MRSSVSSETKASSEHAGSDKASTVGGVDLDRELDAAFEDLNAPPSSLPVAPESDSECVEAQTPVDADSAMPCSSQQTTDAEDEKEGNPPKKEIWEGLPPSSPPPPTSPPLLPLREVPSDTDMDDLELPVATSDMETDFTDMEGAVSASEDGGQMFSEDDMHMPKLTDEDFAAILALTTSVSAQGNDQAMLSEDIFNQFTNINNQSSDGSMGDSDQTITNMQFGDLDFSGFWDTFNPLLEGNMLATGAAVSASVVEGVDDGGLGGDRTMPSFDFGDLAKDGGIVLDHQGLAKDMTSLFSGCVM